MGIKVEAKGLNIILSKISNIANLNLKEALNKSAALVEASAKENLLASGRDTDGEVIRSIAYRVEDNYAEVYAPGDKPVWYEFGTGAFAENGDGRPGWWVWVDPECGAPKSTMRIIYDYEGAKQCAASLAKLYGANHIHVTQGEPPTRFLRSALEDNEEAIKLILKQAIKKGIK